MHEKEGNEYYLERKTELLARYNHAARIWLDLITKSSNIYTATQIIDHSQEVFDTLIATIPFIGGDKNHLTETLIESAMCLALYKAMHKQGRSCVETGKVLYDWITITNQSQPLQIPASPFLAPKDLMERRRHRAQQSQKRMYADDWVYEFIEGDGTTFDYGYDFTECAVLKFYRAQGFAEFTAFFCFLDYPKSSAGGYGLERNHTLAERHSKCDHRFKQGRRTELTWPPPFIKI